MKINVTFLLILFCLIQISYSQSKYGIKLTVKQQISTGGLEGAVLTVENNRTSEKKTYIGSDSPKCKIYNFKLPFNEEFTLAFSKPGYISKCILFDTYLPEQKQNEDFKPMKFAIELVEASDSTNVIDDCMPVSKWRYSEKIDNFDIEVIKKE